MIVDILALLEIIQLGADTVAAIQAVIDLLDPADVPQYSTLTDEEKTAMLKDCTKIIANLALDLACYPTGYNTTILFDLDGNPVP